MPRIFGAEAERLPEWINFQKGGGLKRDICDEASDLIWSRIPGIRPLDQRHGVHFTN